MRRLCEGQIRLQGGIGGSDFKPGHVTAHSGDTDIKVIIGQDRVHVPEVSLAGRKLPDFNEIEFENTVEETEKKSLLLCFWDYQQRSITLGGQDLRACDPAEVRGAMAVVSQQTHLFNTSLRENLLIANPQATPADLEAALMAAQLQELVQRLPAGLDTPVGEFGVQMSGGERQRIAIARAFLRQAPILLLDEPAAGLDLETAAQVWQQLRGLMAGRSVILVTHEWFGLDAMDEILVLQAGRLVQRGQHSDLIRVDGLYRQFWLAWRSDQIR